MDVALGIPHMFSSMEEERHIYLLFLHGKVGALVLRFDLSPTVMAHGLVSSPMTHEGRREGLCI